MSFPGLNPKKLQGDCTPMIVEGVPLIVSSRHICRDCEAGGPAPGRVSLNGRPTCFRSECEIRSACADLHFGDFVGHGDCVWLAPALRVTNLDLVLSQAAFGGPRAGYARWYLAKAACGWTGRLVFGFAGWRQTSSLRSLSISDSIRDSTPITCLLINLILPAPATRGSVVSAFTGRTLDRIATCRSIRQLIRAWNRSG